MIAPAPAPAAAPFDLGFAGKRAVVSGAGGTIGRLLCRELAAQGATVYALDLAAPQFAESKVRGLAVDVRSAAAIGEAANTILADGPLDILVNAHGLQIRASALDCTDEMLSTILDVNLGGCWRLCRAFGPAMRANGGAIVNIASINGILAAKTGAAYGVSKAALIHFTRILALELAPTVRVNAVAPTAVRSAMTEDLFVDPAYEAAKNAAIPLGRVATAADVADVVLMLASSRTAMVTGQTWNVDGGISLP